MTDVSASDLEEIFGPGPVGFLDDSTGPSRLRRFICAFDPDLPLQPPPLPPLDAADTNPAQEDHPDFKGADAWKSNAISVVQGLWTGHARAIEPVRSS